MAGAPLDYLVVGAQKAGSTHLADCLGAHPGLFMCPDEVPYFEDPFYGASDPAELAHAVAGAQPGQARGIHRPEYLAKAECPPRIAADAPAARVLAVLRDPASRAMSAYSWYVQFGLLPLAPIDAGLARLLDGWTDPAYPRSAEVLEWGRYGPQLERFARAVGPDRMLVLLSDDMRAADFPAAAYGFLDVDPSFRPPHAAERTNEGAYDPRRLRWLRARRRFAFSWDDERVYTYVPRRRRHPAKSAVAAGFVAVDRYLLAPVLGGSRPDVPAALASRLRAYYADDVDAVESFLGRAVPAEWRAGA
jgi:hypothetical protein